MAEELEIPSLPQYVTSSHFITKKQQGPLTKMLSRMLKPKMHRLQKNHLKRKKKETVHFY